VSAREEKEELKPSEEAEGGWKGGDGECGGQVPPL